MASAWGEDEHGLRTSTGRAWDEDEHGLGTSTGRAWDEDEHAAQDEYRTSMRLRTSTGPALG